MMLNMTQKLKIHVYQDQTNMGYSWWFNIDIVLNVNGICMGYGWIWFNQHNFGCFTVGSWNFNLRFSVVLEDVSQQKCLFYSILTPKTIEKTCIAIYGSDFPNFYLFGW